MAQQELEKRAKRQAEGIIEAQKKGVQFGGRLSMSMRFSSTLFIPSKVKLKTQHLLPKDKGV